MLSIMLNSAETQMEFQVHQGSTHILRITLLSFLDPLILKVNIFFTLKIRKKLQFQNPLFLPTSAYIIYEWFLANHEKKSFRGPKTMLFFSFIFLLQFTAAHPNYIVFLSVLGLRGRDYFFVGCVNSHIWLRICPKICLTMRRHRGLNFFLNFIFNTHFTSFYIVVPASG